MNWVSDSDEELVRYCLEGGNAGAWEEFVRRFHPVIAATVIRTARRFREPSRALIDDLVQDTYLKICAGRSRVLRDFKPAGPGALYGLLKVVAFSVTVDHFRKRRGHEQPLDDYVMNTVAGFDSLPAREKDILLKQVDECLKAVADSERGRRDRRIFWFRHRHGMTAKEIAAIPGVELTESGVESTIKRLTDQVAARMGAPTPRKETPEEEAEGKSSGRSF